LNDTDLCQAKPVSKNAEDPLHVSHHIARIGYHFRADIVDEAREQLGYVLYRGKFVKEADLQTQRQQAAQDSAVARAFERQGVSADHIRQKSQRETPDKVRAAIKELFPKIPDFDLDEIVRRAWEEGASRVGTNSQLGLPRRVQLATIARIRHTYTDYDQLLRAFEWKEARVMVEPGCLQKLIEWRGENEDQDDDELEEIVRETIVIDDDDDTLEAGISDAYTSPIEIDSGSDASVEIIHHVAAQDFGAESADDRSRRRARRSHPRQRGQDLRHAIAKQKIGDARERIRTRMPPSDITPSAREAVLTAGDGSEPGRINVQPDANGHYPPEIIVDGRRMRLVSWSFDLSRADRFASMSETTLSAPPFVLLMYLRYLPTPPRLLRGRSKSTRSRHPHDRKHMIRRTTRILVHQQRILGLLCYLLGDTPLTIMLFVPPLQLSLITIACIRATDEFRPPMRSPQIPIADGA